MLAKRRICSSKAEYAPYLSLKHSWHSCTISAWMLLFQAR
jgi:hypothetical protein